MSTRTPSPRAPRGRHRRQRTALTVGALALVLVLDAAWAAWSTRAALVSAQENLGCGSDALESGDLERAVGCARRATDDAASAERFRLHPAVAIGGLIPWIDDDVEAVKVLTRATGWAASAATALTDAAKSAGWNGSRVGMIGPGGVVDLDAVERAAPGLEAAASDLERASREIDAIEIGAIVQPLADAVTDAERALDPKARVIGALRDISIVLPEMLGAEGAREYLLSFQNLSAPRGTGGYLGVIGVVRAMDGRLRLTSLDPVGVVPRVPPVDVPADVERRYGRFGIRTTMWASNYPPDVPISSEIAMDIWRRSGRRAVDGVIWADTIWMAAMLAATEPVTSAAWPEPITSDNIVEILNRQVFETNDIPAANETQTEIGVDLWRSVLELTPQPATLLDAMSSGARDGHFAAFSADDEIQTLLERVGAAGEFELGEHPLAVVWQDASANRAGYFAEHEVESTVELDVDGAATVRTTVTMHNHAPETPPSILLGDGKGTPVGWWGADVEVYLSAEAQRTTVRTSVPSVTGFDEAFGHPVADAFLFADAGGSSSATVTYRDARGADLNEGSWSYTTHVRPQPMLRPVTFTLEVSLPEGADIVDMPEGAAIEGGTVVWSGAPTSPLELEIRYRFPA